MLYTTLTIKDKEYKLKLNARACVELEKKLGTNPLNIFSVVAEKGEMPTVGVIINLLHASLQAYHHGLSIDDTFQLYDDYVEEGKTLVDLIPVLMDVFKVSGFFNDAQEAKN